jgi:hypothetical protein
MKWLPASELHFIESGGRSCLQMGGSGGLFGDPPLFKPVGAIFRRFTPSMDAISCFLAGYRAKCLTVP